MLVENSRARSTPDLEFLAKSSKAGPVPRPGGSPCYDFTGPSPRAIASPHLPGDWIGIRRIVLGSASPSPSSCRGLQLDDLGGCRSAGPAQVQTTGKCSC